MGKKKIKICKIQDQKVCRLTLYKRKKGLLKKGMELAVLCGVDVFLTIIDSKQAYTFFTSRGTPKEFVSSRLSHFDSINIQNSYTIQDVIINIYINSN